MAGQDDWKIGRPTKLLLGVAAAGALTGLAVRAWRRREARKGDREGVKTVVTFTVEPTAASQDGEWEALPGRALFKLLGGALAARGYPPSDVGDIEATHDCTVHLDGVPAFLSMIADGRGGDRWTLMVSCSPRRGSTAPPPPPDTLPLRSFLSELDTALRDLEGVGELDWRRR